MIKTFPFCALALIIAASVGPAACSGSEGTTSSGGPAPSGLPQHPLVSECGGFAGQGQPLVTADPPMPDPATYCDAERLLWAYDAATGSLGLTNSRILINCCGNHSISVAKEAEIYVITEVDAPVDGDLRCNCMCVFDFAVTVDSIPSGVIPIKVIRNVTDSSNPPQVVYEGPLDLAQGQGTITIDPNTVDPWCGAIP